MALEFLIIIIFFHGTYPLNLILSGVVQFS